MIGFVNTRTLFIYNNQTCKNIYLDCIKKNVSS